MKLLRFILLFIGALGMVSLYSAKNPLDPSGAVTDPVKKNFNTIAHCVALKELKIPNSTNGALQKIPFKDLFSYLRGQCDPVFDTANAPFMWDDTNNGIGGSGYGGTNQNLFKDPSLKGEAKPQDEVICGIVNHKDNKRLLTNVVRGSLEQLFNKHATSGYLYLYKGSDDTMNQRNYYTIKRINQKLMINN